MNRRMYINRLVSKTLKKNHRISIVPTKRPPPFLGQQKEYASFVHNTIDELSNEILSQVESCAWDYPNYYVSLHITNPDDQETVHVLYEPKDN